MSGRVNDIMDKGSIMDSEDRIERIVDIYVSAEAVRDMKHKKETEDFNTEEPRTPRHTEDFNTEEPRTPRHTGSDGVTISRAAGVCLGLMCVLLMTAVIVLCFTFTQERQQLLTKITNLTQEKDQTQTNNMNLIQERQQLQTKITNLTEERQQLLTKITNLTQERDQLLTNNMSLTQERQQLKTKITNLTEERDQLKSERNDLKFADGWKCHQSSLYLFSSEKKSWTESRRYCRERGTDLIIINNIEEQDFVKNICGSDHFWIGLTDVEEEGRWKWVDGSTLTSGFWASGEPNNQGTEEDCANTRSSGWFDTKCDSSVKWICEKSILK
ncbi:CD209 antigen-like protein C isoform X1 [Carassius gibelio]|uniref:CD209 antigen-like protein C isoform X1 n=1 Tax=Carassius gibelio TaxID=101364 RepID=UPI002278164B|nr:CD209 antigen-like protein C isoform X1 [Carassius gibelio]